MQDRERDIFITLIDAGVDESALLAFIEGESEGAAEIVEMLGRDAALAELVWQLRADRDAIRADARNAPLPAQTQAMVASVLDQEIAEEYDAEALRRIEHTGRSDAGVRKPAHKAAKGRKARAPRGRSRLPRVLGSLAAAAVIVLTVGIIVPKLNYAPMPAQNEQAIADSESRTPDEFAPSALPGDTDTAIAAIESSEEDLGPAARPLERPTFTESPAEALRLAREGRLVVRLTSMRDSTSAELADDLTTGSDLMRFAVVEGRVTDEMALSLDEALPALEAPVIASGNDEDREPALTANRHRVGSYLLRVEPTERAFTMLISKLRNYPGVSVELVGSVDAVTTPTSAKDLSSLSQSPTRWTSRISVPVVVDSIR